MLAGWAVLIQIVVAGLEILGIARIRPLDAIQHIEKEPSPPGEGRQI